MAIKARAVDGLVHRLLKQSSSPAAVEPGKISAKPTGSLAAPSSDAAGQSKSPAKTQALLPERPGEKALESHLLTLYRSKGKSGGQM